MDSEKQYVEAFNNGYTLSEYEPKLLNALSKNHISSNNYLEGFFAGKEQFELENSKLNLFELQQLRSKSHNNERDFEREE